MPSRSNRRRSKFKRPAPAKKNLPSDKPSVASDNQSVQDVVDITQELRFSSTEKVSVEDVPKQKQFVDIGINVDASGDDDVPEVQQVMDSTDDVDASDETEFKSQESLQDNDGTKPDTESDQEGSKGKRTKKCVSYNFNEDEQIQISQWYKVNPCLYNKRNRDFKKTVFKENMIEEKAKTFDPPCSCKYKMYTYKFCLHN